jgi:hypothetical protein
MSDDGIMAFAVITNLLFVLWVIIRFFAKKETKKNLENKYAAYIEAIHEFPDIEIVKSNISDDRIMIRTKLFEPFYDLRLGGPRRLRKRIGYIEHCLWIREIKDRILNEYEYSFSVTFNFDNSRVSSFHNTFVHYDRYPSPNSDFPLSKKECDEILSKLIANIIHLDEFKKASFSVR